MSLIYKRTSQNKLDFCIKFSFCKPVDKIEINGNHEIKQYIEIDQTTTLLKERYVSYISIKL